MTETLSDLPPELATQVPEDVTYLLDRFANATTDEIVITRDDALQVAQYVADLRVQREHAIRGWSRALDGWRQALGVDR